MPGVETESTRLKINVRDLVAALNIPHPVDRRHRLHDWLGGHDGPKRFGIQYGEAHHVSDPNIGIRGSVWEVSLPNGDGTEMVVAVGETDPDKRGRREWFVHEFVAPKWQSFQQADNERWRIISQGILRRRNRVAGKDLERRLVSSLGQHPISRRVLVSSPG